MAVCTGMTGNALAFALIVSVGLAVLLWACLGHLAAPLLRRIATGLVQIADAAERNYSG